MTFLPCFHTPSIRILFSVLCLAISACDNGTPSTAPSAETADAQPLPSYEELAKTKAALRLNQQGDSAVDLGEYRAAIVFYQQSMDSAAAQADSFPYYDSKLDLAHVHDRLSEFQKAIEIAEPVVAAFVRSGDTLRIGRAYNTLAGFYGKAKMLEKSTDATQKGFEILKQHSSLIHRCAAYNQMAFTYSDQGDWAKALPLLDTALQLMVASGTLSQRPGMRLNIGNCHRNLGHWAEARRYLEAAAAEADSLGQVHVLARAIERLSEVAESTGDPTSALRLFRRAKAIRDSLFTAEKARSIQELEVQYETREKEQEIELLRANEQLQKTQRGLLLASLLAAVAIFGFGLYIQRLKLQNARQILAQKQQEMADYTDLLLAKNTQLTALEQTLQHSARMPSPPEAEEDNAAVEGNLYNNRILTDKDWESFKYRFERVHPGYLQRLRVSYPDLSGAEERLSLLIKINLNSHEIANILGITANAVKKGRQRLRKRLALTLDDDLEAFIAGF